MRPVLAVIPALPSQVIWGAVLAILAGGGLVSWRTRQTAALVVAAVLAGAVALLGRNAITLHSYGLFLVSGFFLSTWLACLEADRRGHSPETVLDAAVPLLLVSILCCRILYFLVYPDQWRGFGEFLQIWNGGLSFHGAIVGGLGTLAYYAYRRGLPFGTLTDFVAPGAFLGIGVGRIGCFMNGCCYGHATDLPWAVRFTSEMDRHVLTPPCHPAQLYSTLMCLGLFAVLWLNRGRASWNRFSGHFTLIFLALFACERFVMEIFRNGATAPLAFGLEWLTRAQLASILGLIAVAFLWGVQSRRHLPPSTPQGQNPVAGA